LASTANSIGNLFKTSLLKPFTIKAIAFQLESALVAIKNFFANFTQLRVLFFAVDFTFDVRKYVRRSYFPLTRSRIAKNFLRYLHLVKCVPNHGNYFEIFGRNSL
jgi:hypothetical protein